MERNNAVLFDLDGTLVDSNERLVSCLQQALAEHRSVSANDIRQYLGRPLPDVIASLAELDASVSAEVAQNYRTLYRHSDQRPVIFDGLLPVIERLAEEYQLAVVTNRTEGVEADLARVGLKSFFDVILCGDQVQHNKPHPEPLLTAIRSLGGEPQKAVYVGDTASDVQAARGANMSSVLVQYCGDKYYGAHLLKANAVVFRVDDLPQAIDEIFSEVSA